MVTSWDFLISAQVFEGFVLSPIKKYVRIISDYVFCVFDLSYKTVIEKVPFFVVALVAICFIVSEVERASVIYRGIEFI